jgi:hypothetical protein
MEYIIIQSPNTHPLKLHFKKKLANTNLSTFHILCWNEKDTQYSCKSRNLQSFIQQISHFILFQ